MAIKGWSILISLYIESTLTFLIQNFAHSFNCEAGPESTFKQYQEKMFELTYHLLVTDSEGIKLNGINVSILLLIIGLNLYLKYIIFTFFFLSENHLQNFSSLIMKMQTLETESHINLSFSENDERVRKSYFLESTDGHCRLKSTKHKSKPGTNSTDTVLHIRVKYWKLYIENCKQTLIQVWEMF